MTGERVLRGCTGEQIARATEALFCLEQTHLSEYRDE